MMLKRSTTESKPRAKARLVRAGVASLAAASAVAAMATGCLDRKVVQQEPQTSNVFVDQIIQTSVDKIDLLFMIDNSSSMADKQEILKNAVPVLVNRLVSPICVDDSGAPTGGVNTKGVCTVGQPEFNAINDIHIGIVTSSLGSHGATQVAGGGSIPCTTPGPPNNDAGHMVGSVRDSFPIAMSWNNTGFLAWDPNGKDMPAGTADATALATTFQNLVIATGQDGCGFESQLEGWYRFLIDPEPPMAVTLSTPKTGSPSTVRSSSMNVDANGNLVLTNGKPTCTGCDATVLAQRAAFLRPDSLVAIVMLTDENDCSVADTGLGWLNAEGGGGPGYPSMPRATAACETNPNSPCCFSCAQNGTPPTGCPSAADDTVCKAGINYQQNDINDALNLRCFKQRQRFGFDLLYSTQRYVDGLTQPTLPLQSQAELGKTVMITNPLYDTGTSTGARRPSSLVFLAGIVGVPWQDIADDASLTGPGLNYLSADELLAKDRWTDLLGVPGGTTAGGPPVPPRDPFMIEQVDPRIGGPNGTAASNPTNAIANVTLTPASSTNPTANAINGHEWNPPGRSDLQYACTFKLAAPGKDCSLPANAQSCDCTPDAPGSTTNPNLTAANSPLCQPPGGGAPTTQQNYAKGYPGARELQVLKDFGANAIVASICPKVTTAADPANPQNDPSYGYNPAVAAIIARLKTALQGKCLPRAIQTDTVKSSPTYGQVLCSVVEAQKSGCNCATPGRSPANPKVLSAVQAQLQMAGFCGAAAVGTTPACKDWCECEINQLTGDALNSCQVGNGNTAGYCYVDANAEVTNPTGAAAIAQELNKCPATEQQLLKFVDDPATGTKTPAPDAVAFIACLGAAIVQVSSSGGGGAM